MDWFYSRSNMYHIMNHDRSFCKILHKQFVFRSSTSLALEHMFNC